MRRSDSAPISATASARLSAANATGSAWKLPPESTSAVSALFRNEHQRIVGDAIGLAQQHRARRLHLVEAGAHDLRLAAQRIRVLHLAAFAVAGVDGTVGEQLAIRGRRGDLARMSAQLVDARIEGTGRTFRRVHRQRARDQRGGVQVVDGEQVPQRERGRGLRAVEQRQAFLGGELDRVETGAASDLRRAAGSCRRIPLRPRLTTRWTCAPAARDRRSRPPNPWQARAAARRRCRA